MRRDEQDRLAAEFEAEMDNPDLWEEVPAPSPYKRRRLGAQVTIRLDADDAERLRQLASRYDCNYTSMIRVWIAERLRTETAKPATPPPLDLQPAGQGGWPPTQVTGTGRLIAP